jgi:hypothetical protein
MVRSGRRALKFLDEAPITRVTLAQALSSTPSADRPMNMPQLSIRQRLGALVLLAVSALAVNTGLGLS